MFNNLKELKEEILQGKTNQEIIAERLKFLNSEEYKSKRLPTIKREGTEQVLFYDGFINPEEKVAFNGGMAEDTIYLMDEIEIYNQLIDLIRLNMDKKGYSFKELIKIVRGYFQVDENSKYAELTNFLKNARPREPYFARKVMPRIINHFVNSNYSRNLKEFGMGYFYHFYENNKTDRETELDENYFKSVNWEKLNEESNTVLPISVIKGAGIAACTEYSMLTQNCLAFLGYDAYMLGGELTGRNGTEAHNFNVRKTLSDQYEIVDTAQFVPRGKIENASSIDDVRNMQTIVIQRPSDESLLYYAPAKEIRTKTLLEQKEAELSRLQKEEHELITEENRIKREEGKEALQ